MRQAHPIAAGQRDAAAFVDLNRGKRSLALGEKPAAAAEVLRRLLLRADVLITDLSDERLGALGLGELVKPDPTHKSRLIVVAISPWGRLGPLSAQPGSELTAQAMAGYTRYLGSHGEPARRLGADVASTSTGIFALQAVLAALYWRAKNGAGQRVDVSLWGSLLSMKSIHLAAQSNPDEYKGPRVGGANNPPELGWKARDDRVFIQFGGSVGPTGRAGWEGFVDEAGLSELKADPRCDKTGRSSTGHGAHVHELRSTYERAFSKFSGEQVAELARKHGGNSSPYYKLDRTLTHPQADAIGVLSKVTSKDGSTRSVRRFPARFSKLRPRLSAEAPRLGQHNDEILRELELSGAAIASTYESGGLSRNPV